MSDLESLAAEHFGTLTAAEIKLLQNACAGTLAVCGPNDNLNATINDPNKAESWGADRSIRGELVGWLCTDRKATEFVDHGGIQVFGARVIGPVKLLSVPIQFPLVFACCEFCDEINLQSARMRTLSFTQSQVQSVYADGVVISGAFFLRDCRAALLQFPGAHIEGQFDCNGSTFNTLILDGAVVNVGVLLRRTVGQIKMTGARIATDLDCEGGTLNATYSSSGCALDAEGVKVEGSVFLRAGFRALGSVKLHGAQVGMNLDCTGGEFAGTSQTTNGSGEALRADLAVVKGTVFLSNGFHARGAVYFISSQVGGDFNCDHATFETGLTIERATIHGAFFWHGVTIAENAGLDLINTSVDSLSDETASWPSHAHLEFHGFVYERIALASPRKSKERLDWIARQKSFAAQPYRQLAAVLKDEGDDAGARAVLYEMERLRRSSETGFDRVWNWALRFVIGYGYFPWRALRWFAVLVVLGFLLFAGGFYAGSIVPTDKDAYAYFMQNHSLPADHERFHPLIYSLENSLSIFKLGQVDRWQPDPASQTLQSHSYSMTVHLVRRLVSPDSLRCFRWSQVLLGWFLATMWIAGVTGLVRRD